MKKVAGFFKWIGRDIKEIGVTFKEGDWKTRVSFLILGFGPLLRKYFLRGIGLLALEILYIWYMVGFGAQYLAKIATLGTEAAYMDLKTFAVGSSERPFYIILSFDLAY